MSEQMPLPIGRRPTHRLCRVVGQGRASTWTPIGAAWPNGDGLGFNVTCDLVPLQGRIVMRVIAAREEPETNGGQS
jgi:hypothetical protein